MAHNGGLWGAFIEGFTFTFQWWGVVGLAPFAALAGAIVGLVMPGRVRLPVLGLSALLVLGLLLPGLVLGYALVGDLSDNVIAARVAGAAAADVVLIGLYVLMMGPTLALVRAWRRRRALPHTHPLRRYDDPPHK